MQRPHPSLSEFKPTDAGPLGLAFFCSPAPHGPAHLFLTLVWGGPGEVVGPQTTGHCTQGRVRPATTLP